MPKRKKNFDRYFSKNGPEGGLVGLPKFQKFVALANLNEKI